MKKWNIFILSVFAIPIFTVAIWSLVDTDATVSTAENRALAGFPELTAEAWFSGGWQHDFGSYYADTFPMRDSLLSAEGAMNSFYLFTPFELEDEGVALIMQGVDETDVAEGGESIFDFQDDVQPDGDGVSTSPPSAVETAPPETSPPETSPPETAPPETSPPPPPELPDNEVVASTGVVIISGGHAIEIVTRNDAGLDRYADMLTGYAESMPDATVYSLIAPSSAAFNAPEKYRTGVHDQQAIIEYVYEQVKDVVTPVYAYDELRQHSDEYLYFRTDHHWTQLGAYYAYRAFCEASGQTPYALRDFEMGRIDGFVGSLYAHTRQNPASKVLSDNPDIVYTWRPVREFETRIYPNLNMSAAQAYKGYVVSNTVNVANKYLAFIAGDNPLTVIETDVEGGRSCIVLKESFGNAFVPFLVNHYSTVYVIDPRKFNGEGKPNGRLDTFVAQHEIDDVIVLNYPFAVNSSFAAILNRMIAK